MCAKKPLAYLISAGAFVLGCSIAVLIHNSGDCIAKPIEAPAINWANAFDAEMLNQFAEKFIYIYRTNMVVLLLILYAGFFSAGALSCLILLWNGLLAAGVFARCYSMMAWYDLVHYFALHGVLELSVFICAGAVSLGGVRFFRHLLKNEIRSDLIPRFSVFAGLGLLLAVAACIEAFLLVNC